MATAERHHAISDQFLRHAEDEFAKGDLLQASEKAWGAFAHCVNAIARERGWRSGSHQGLVRNARNLIKREPDHAERRHRLIRSVESLHANFYNDNEDAAAVREGIEDARELVETLPRLASLPDPDEAER